MKLTPTQLIDLLREIVHIGFLDRQRGDENLLARRNPRAIAVENPGYQLHRLITKLEWLLDHGSVNRLLLDAIQGFVLFIEGDDFHFAGLAGLADCPDDRRAVVRPKSNHAGDVRLIDQSIGGIRFRAHSICTVGANVKDLNVGALQRLFEALISLLCVGRIKRSDEDHYFPALWQRFLNQATGLASGSNVISANVTNSIAAGSVTVLGDYERLLRGAVKHLKLVHRIDGTDRDAVDPLRQQVVDYALLLSGGVVRVDPELDIRVRKVAGRFFGSLASNGPKVGGVIGDESEFATFARASVLASAQQQRRENQ